MEATFQRTDKSIFAYQNEEFLLKCQLAQRKEYTHAKKASRLKSIFNIIFAVISICASCIDCNTLSAISSLFAVLVVVFNKYFDKYILYYKKYAASIQQYIDVTLFTYVIGESKFEWGELPNNTELANAVSELSDVDTSDVKNWYSDYSTLPGEYQIFYCQRENVRWDYKLHRSYKNFIFGNLLVIALIIVVNIYFFASDIIMFICILSWFIPLGEYIYSIHKDIRQTISFYKKIDNYSNNIEKKLLENGDISIKQDLIDLQYMIRKRREVGFLIPDWFYRRKKNKYQKKESSIAENVLRLSKDVGKK